MNIATGAMNTLLPKLIDLVVGEYNLQKGVKGEIKELEEELTSMNAALRTVSKVPTDQLNEQVKIWARDVRELSYDIEDAVDTFMLQIKGHESGESFSFKGLIARSTNLLKNTKTNHKIHNVIKDIMGQAKKIKERHDRYKVDDLVARLSTVTDDPRLAAISVTVDPRLEAIYKKATDLVGIEGPKNELAKKLIEEGSSSGQHPKIISIVGFGGLGKTTLANALFHDLKSKFDCHAFVSVSLNPDIKMILRNILSQLDNNSRINEALELMQLIDMIREILESKRCLSVIDDVWNESAWNTIKLALQDAKHGSKIIITTRNKDVAKYAGGGVYELNPLSRDDSRKLLNMRVFDSEDGCPLGLREVSKKILKKCGGVPLAIITIASLLASKPAHSVEWEKVNNSIGSGLENSRDVDKMRKILLLSYNDLPIHLKTCFLYLGLFPEDRIIEKKSLVSSWIAEGFIVEETRQAGTTLWDIGESYFNELINRSLIQPEYKVHDMVLDLINQLSAEEGFATTLLPDGQQTDTCASASASRTKKMRRLSLHNFNKSHHYSREAIEEWSKLRSLIVFGKVDSTLSPLLTFQVLRVLRLEDCRYLDGNCLDDICKLRHLRFLLLNSICGPIPESIGKLESLETLDIRNSWIRKSLEKTFLIMPMSFVKLQKLVRLIVKGVGLPLGLPLGDMKSLQVLDGIQVWNLEQIKVIGNLESLSVLRIELNCDMVVEGASDVVAYIFMCLQRCANFKELDIKLTKEQNIRCSSDYMPHVSSCLQRFTCPGYMTAFPGWINSSTLSCLTYLAIRLNKAPQPEHLEKLAELPSLRSLRLLFIVRYNLRPHKLIITSGGFRCLGDLGINVRSVFQPGAMPNLRRLQLWPFGLTKTITPSGLENLRSLRHVIINGEVDAVDVTEALEDNPNHPTVEIRNEGFVF